MQWGRPSSMAFRLKREFYRMPGVYSILTVLVFMQILEYIYPSSVYTLGLTPAQFLRGYFWTILTHIFIHDPRYLTHLLFNGIALYIIGRYAEPMLGTRLVILVFMLTGLMGGALTILASILLPYVNPFARHLIATTVIGASGAILGLFSFIISDNPNAEVIFFIFPPFPIIIPIKARGKTVLRILIITELLFGLLSWPFDVYGRWGHLGGLLGGIILYKYWLWKEVYKRSYGVEFYDYR